MKELFKDINDFIRSIFGQNEFIPLHEPCFSGNEKKYIVDCIDSTFVSSVGKYVDLFEEKVADFTGAKYAIATINGTAALHMALLLTGVDNNDEVLTQAISFVGTANAISYCGADPVFLDSDTDTMGLSPGALQQFLEEKCIVDSNGETRNKDTKKRIKACVPVHIFGHPARIEQIIEICNNYKINVIEDAAESIGSVYKGKHTGTFGSIGIISFNGNKTITTGGGGMILTDNDKIAAQAKHLTTTAKTPHQWEYRHNLVGYNYRLPNINAAIGCGQMEKLPEIIKRKQNLAKEYNKFFGSIGITFMKEPENSFSNYWLNAIALKNIEERNQFLEYTNASGVMTRPMWNLLPDLPPFKMKQKDSLNNARWLSERIVNIPSSIKL